MVQDALTSLPCVEPGSIKIDVTVKEARFKTTSKCAIQEVVQAIEKVGFAVADAKLAP